MSAIKTLYAVLGLGPSATPEEIEAAYAGARQAGQRDADDLSLLRIAYDTLSVPEQRAAYDRKLAQHELAASRVQVMDAGYAPARSSKGKWLVLSLMLVGAIYYWLQGTDRPLEAVDSMTEAFENNETAAADAALSEIAASAGNSDDVALYDPAALRPAERSATAASSTEQVQVMPTRGARKDGFDPEYLAWSAFTIRQRNKIGSGVLIAEDRVLTNCHVLAGGAMGIVVIHSLTKRVTKVEKYARLDGEDACLLYAPGAGGEVIDMGNSAALQAGDVLYSFGHPGGSAEVIWSEGKLLNRTVLGGEEFLMSSNYCRPGSSGGPLLDVQGQLVGIVTAGQLFRMRGGEIRHGACLSVTEATARGLLRKSLFPIGFAPAQHHKNY